MSTGLSTTPPVVLKRLPAGISRRLTDILSDEEVFAEAELPYNEALKKSGYSESVMFLSERKGKQRRDQRKRSQSRKRNITWFTPPFIRKVATDIACRFFGLVDRHFPRGSDLYKIFNRNTVKVSYSCTPNVGTIIKRHNAMPSTQTSRVTRGKHATAGGQVSAH